MKTYLSFGGGVNSVAMMLFLLDRGDKFEAIFVDHGADWPETYEYFEMFQEWLKNKGHGKITILKPDVQGDSDLYNYYFSRSKVPSIMKRDCTDKFKIRTVTKYVKTPCFMLLGIDFGEAHRAKINHKKGIENRFPLIEEEITRQGCKDIIKAHGLPVPMKSGCYLCMYQKKGQWESLRRLHPDLFCKASKLEEKCMEGRIAQGKKPFTLCNNGKTLSTIIMEKQRMIFEEDDFPPCECGL